MTNLFVEQTMEDKDEKSLQAVHDCEDVSQGNAVFINHKVAKSPSQT